MSSSRKKQAVYIRNINIGEKLHEGTYASLFISNPVYVSFEDQKTCDRCLPEGVVDLSAGRLRTNAAIGARKAGFRTALVSKDHKTLGVIVNMTTFRNRFYKDIQVTKYKDAKEVSWHEVNVRELKVNTKELKLDTEELNLDTDELKLEAIDELEKIDTETRLPIENVFLHGRSDKIKSSIPKDARLVSGAKLYELNGENFRDDATFVVQCRNGITKVIGELRDNKNKQSAKEIIKACFPYYLADKCIYNTPLGDIFGTGKKRKNLTKECVASIPNKKSSLLNHSTFFSPAPTKIPQKKPQEKQEITFEII